MTTKPWIRSTIELAAASAGVAAGAYAAYAAVSWYRYGRVAKTDDHQPDEWLDRFMPAYDVVERHHIRVAAPAAVTLAAAREQDLMRAPLVHAIFKARELVLRATPDQRPQPRGLLAATLALGWGVLAEVPDREIVVGAVTKPWEAERHVPGAAGRRVRGLLAAWLRQDRMDAAGRSDRRRHVGLPYRNPCRCHGCDRPRSLPSLLGVRLPGDRDDSPALSAAAQARRRTARWSRASSGG